jgi:hypothetical protein
VALRFVKYWGSTLSDRAAVWPCDTLLPDANLVLYRGIDVAAPAEITFLWICQLRLAPYSYDWLDNRGLRSPRKRTPGLDRLAVRQRFMRAFAIVGFTPGAEVTARARARLFGAMFVTYRVIPMPGDVSRIAVKLVGRHRRGPIGLLWRLTLPAGDLVMMRKQLRTLAACAEREVKQGALEPASG